MLELKKSGSISILGALLLTVILILVLSHYNISLKKEIESPSSKENFGYVASNSQNIWNKYLAKPASYLWNEIFIDLLWDSFVVNMKKIKNAEPTDYQSSTPSVNITPN